MSNRYGEKPPEPKPRQPEMQTALSTLIAALEPLTDDERKRVIRSARVFLGIAMHSED